MARTSPLLFLALACLAGVGCSSPTMHTRVQPPTFAQAAPLASAESWASVMALPGIEQSASTYSRRDAALGLPPPGSAGVAGAWREADRASISSYLLIPLPRSDRTFLFFDSPSAYERRTPQVPRRAHPWHAAW
ncbi:MAG: hypothetical protein ACIAQU_13415 [Phycisphaerales bacterium JB064]